MITSKKFQLRKVREKLSSMSQTMKEDILPKRENPPPPVPLPILPEAQLHHKEALINPTEHVSGRTKANVAMVTDATLGTQSQHALLTEN